MGEKTANPGEYVIPTAPSSGISVSPSVSANTFGSYVQIRSASGNALYIVGVLIIFQGTLALQFEYIIGTGGSGSETIVATGVVGASYDGTSGHNFNGNTIRITKVAVAASTRIAMKVSCEQSNDAGATVYLLCIDQSNVVDNGVATAADVTKWNGTAVVTPDTAGYPKVTIKDGTGTGEIDTTSGGVLVSSIASGGITTASFAAGAIDAAAIAANAIGASELAADAVTEIADGVWNATTAGHVAVGTFGQASQVINAGTCQTGSTSTTIKLASGASASDSYYNNMIVLVETGTGIGQWRRIISYVGSTRVATVNTWATTPGATDTYCIIGF